MKDGRKHAPPNRTRRRDKVKLLQTRVGDDVHAWVTMKAEDLGMSTASWLRWQLMGMFRNNRAPREG